MKKQITVIVIGIVALALISLFAFCFFGKEQVSTDEIDYYRALSGEIQGKVAMERFGEPVGCPYDLPTLEELKPYSDYRFDHTEYRQSIFMSFSYCLILSYGEEDYEAKKAWLADIYPTATEENARTFATFEMDGFRFRAIEGGPYPNYMMFVGFCDEKQEIAILYYEDDELDTVRSIQTTLKEETGWETIANP